MRLDLRSILHVPGASLPFSFALDLSGLDFYGEHPFAGPVQVSGTVRNQADALVLEGTAETTLELVARKYPRRSVWLVDSVTTLELVCDRCLKPFCRDMRVPVDSLLAETLEDEENDEILLLDNGTVDLDEVFTTALVLAMDSKHVCSEDCKGLCATCGADLNEGPCGCKPEIDPRFAALAQLLDKESE